MIKLEFSIAIKATTQKVYETMLGLKDKTNYEHWTAAFNPTSTYEGSWDTGSTIHFIGVDGNGKKAGMVSKIEVNQPAKFVSILHYGIVDGENEITSGELVEKWAGGHENYSFEESNGLTILKVTIDVIDEYIEYFNAAYPMALDKLKAISE